MFANPLPMDKSVRDTRTIDLKLLERHPLKVVIAAFILFLVGTVVLFVYAYVPIQLKYLKEQLSECDKAKSEAESKIPIAPEDPNALTLAPAEVGQQFLARDGRDAEQESFSRSLNGKNIHWEVEVRSISKGLGYVHFKLPGDDSCAPVSLATFGDDIKERAESLQPGDLIRLHGTLSFSSLRLVTVHQASFEFLRAARPKTDKSE